MMRMADFLIHVAPAAAARSTMRFPAQVVVGVLLGIGAEVFILPGLDSSAGDCEQNAPGNARVMVISERPFGRFIFSR